MTPKQIDAALLIVGGILLFVGMLGVVFVR